MTMEFKSCLSSAKEHKECGQPIELHNCVGTRVKRQGAHFKARPLHFDNHLNQNDTNKPIQRTDQMTKMVIRVEGIHDGALLSISDGQPPLCQPDRLLCAQFRSHNLSKHAVV